ncbi:hypothetical protein C3L33_21177, partial [Rhododendron williamsianum]
MAASNEVHITIPKNETDPDCQITDYSQRAQWLRAAVLGANDGLLPNPVQAAAASALAFTIGAIVPLLAAAFIRNHKVRLGVVVAAASMALVAFGGVGAVLGKTSVVRSGTRVVVGGWMAMAITFGLTKLIGSNGLQM